MIHVRHFISTFLSSSPPWVCDWQSGRWPTVGEAGGTSGVAVHSSEGSGGEDAGERDHCHGQVLRTSGGQGSVAERARVGNMRSVDRSPERGENQQNRSRGHSGPALS